MDPFQRDFFLVYALIAGAIVFYIRWDGKRQRESRLRMENSKKLELPNSGAAFGGNVKPNSAQKPELNSTEPLQEPRNLNVIFQYNGHGWDAYEVLGIPAGSPMDRVKSAYEASLAKVDPASRSFLDAAYSAIRERRENQG